MSPEDQIANFVKSISNEMVSYLRTKYKTPGFNPKISVTFGKNRTTSRGGFRKGRPFIDIVGKRFVPSAQYQTLMNEREDPAFNDDKVIGALYNVTWMRAMAGLVAHELAHAVQFDADIKVEAKQEFKVGHLDDYHTYMRGHNGFWRRIYADLRIKFVNSKDYAYNIPNKKDAPAEVKVPEPAKVSIDSSPVPPSATPTLYVKYAYKGEYSYSWYYIGSKLVLVLAEKQGKIYVSEDDKLTLMNYKNIVEARKQLIGM